MTDKTPRTDALVDMILMGAKGHASTELIEHARQLERELTAAKAEIERLERDGVRLREFLKQDRVRMPRIVPWNDIAGLTAYNTPEAIIADIDAAIARTK